MCTVTQRHKNAVTWERLAKERDSVGGHRMFCAVLLYYGFHMHLKQSQISESRYVTIIVNGRKPFKVRFSNHKPKYNLGLHKRCDFYAGRGHTYVHALEAVHKHFLDGTGPKFPDTVSLPEEMKW